MSQGQQLNQTPFSLINYEAEIQITENYAQYQKTKYAAKKLDLNPSPEDVLNNMILPRDWKTEDQKHFMQYVSHSKSSRDDVFILKDALQKTLQHRQARTQGICPIRQQLFSQAFDELIRQVTINCPQRGLLLMRVRDEHKMTIAAYQTLYQSSIQYGMRKQIESQQGMEELQEELRTVQQQYEEQRNKMTELESKKQFLQKRVHECRSIQAMENQLELQTIQVQAQNLQAFLEAVREEKAKQLISLASTLNNPPQNVQKKGE